jgi:hypothetical protein
MRVAPCFDFREQERQRNAGAAAVALPGDGSGDLFDCSLALER